jgi:hypothetical protein
MPVDGILRFGVDRRAQHGEPSRVRLVVGVLLALTGIRRVAGGTGMASPVFWWILSLRAIAWRTNVTPSLHGIPEGLRYAGRPVDAAHRRAAPGLETGTTNPGTRHAK